MDLIASRRGMIAGAEANAHDYAVVVVVGLNWLYGIRADNVVIGPITVAQREAHAVLFDAAFDLHARLVTSAESRDRRGWGAFEDRGKVPRLDLIAAAVAVPDCAARCDPAKLIKGPLGDASECAHDLSKPTRWAGALPYVQQRRPSGVYRVEGSAAPGRTA